MSTETIRNQKKCGRPPLLSESDGFELADLYFTQELTAKQIREIPKFSVINSDDSCRAMAKRYWRKMAASS